LKKVKKSNPKPTIKLRGHHLVCLHFFKGEGYNSKFLENLEDLLGEVEKGDEVEICSGPDDICKKCPYLIRDRCLYDEDAEEEIREMDRKALRLLRLRVNGKVTWKSLRDKIPQIIHEWSKNYCEECDWKKVCITKLQYIA
jgi:hypothetical protein